jgi:hypothetical protein
MRGGVLATAVGAPAAVATGGISAVVAVALIGVMHPQLRVYNNQRQ